MYVLDQNPVVETAYLILHSAGQTSENKGSQTGKLPFGSLQLTESNGFCGRCLKSVVPDSVSFILPLHLMHMLQLVHSCYLWNLVTTSSSSLREFLTKENAGYLEDKAFSPSFHGARDRPLGLTQAMHVLCPLAVPSAPRFINENLSHFFVYVRFGLFWFCLVFEAGFLTV